jgi:hypothetical protein
MLERRSELNNRDAGEEVRSKQSVLPAGQQRRLAEVRVEKGRKKEGKE